MMQLPGSIVVVIHISCVILVSYFMELFCQWKYILSTRLALAYHKYLNILLQFLSMRTGGSFVPFLIFDRKMLTS
ncbi:hypothetical protein RJT34_09535 [Clitoria ternatea]|uniref:Uncharacterized protein n=1 Tax=Clitoria ternatea TaxID=43366 RepID=A0AAN9PTC1_CLITE